MSEKYTVLASMYAGKKLSSSNKGAPIIEPSSSGSGAWMSSLHGRINMDGSNIRIQAAKALQTIIARKNLSRLCMASEFLEFTIN
jgi:hypothetical protein